MSRRATIAVAVVVALAVAGLIATVRKHDDEALGACGPGFSRTGARCCPGGTCSADLAATCPSPLVMTERGCDERERDVVDVPATIVVVGPSDWEAEGRVKPRTVQVAAFAIDRLEVSVGRFCRDPRCRTDVARAATGMTFEQARDFCSAKGGHLPTDDEWLAAAGGDRPRRYPWGDTGAVCRRAAWGLESGPCAQGASGPDTVGAHPDGMTPLGIHDLAGNVAEWVDTGCQGSECPRVVRGGSWRTQLATELRTWLRREATAAERAGDITIGFRCAYSPNNR